MSEQLALLAAPADRRASTDWSTRPESRGDDGEADPLRPVLEAFDQALELLERLAMQQLGEPGRPRVFAAFVEHPDGVRVTIARALAKHRSGRSSNGVGLLVTMVTAGEHRIAAFPAVNEGLFDWARLVLRRLPREDRGAAIADKLRTLRLTPAEAVEVRRWLEERAAA